jgi:spermidine/putrescine transport system ATP-binding protein
MTDAITIAAVRKQFEGSSHPALGGVSFAIRRNEFFTLLGPSGCGKTTLLRMIAGFEEPDEGDILLDGRSVLGLNPNRRPVNTVFQSYALFPHMTVAENIAFGPEMLGLKRPEIRDRVARMVALLRLDGMADRRPRELSGGQQQRVALGRALAAAPQVLLLDEPLSALDLKLRKDMQIELKRLQQETGITFVFVTHDQEEALTMSDRIAVMARGEVMQIGAPVDIYEYPANRFVAEFIGDTNLVAATCIARDGTAGRFALAGGAEIVAADAAAVAPGAEVTLAFRPERVTLGGPLTAIVQHAVYLGTDALLHAGLPDGSVLRARLRAGGVRPPDEGTAVGFGVAPDAVRVFTP